MTIYRGPGGTGEATTDTDITEVRAAIVEASAIAAATTTSYLEELYQNIANYGEVFGDGVTDNTSVFNATEASEFDSFFIPNGIYKITQTSLTKNYIGFGSIKFGDNYIQDCNYQTEERPRKLTGPLLLESPNDISLAPTGSVVFNNKRASGVGIALNVTDALTAQGLTSGICPGIRFTNSPSTNSNTLDWYQEGTWTPNVQGSGTAGTTAYTERYARFTRIGNQCRVRIRVKFTVTGGTGTPIITNLPFQALTDGPNSPPAGFGKGFLSDTSYSGEFGWYALGFNVYVYQNSEAGGVSNLSDMSQGWDIDMTYDIAAGV